MTYKQNLNLLTLIHSTMIGTAIKYLLRKPNRPVRAIFLELNNREENLDRVFSVGF